MAYVNPRVFTIAPGTPFLATVVEAFVDGHLIDGFAAREDPLSLSRVTIYVPTRRAARELRSAFLDVLGRQTTFLPTVRPLGEFDEEIDLAHSLDEAAIDIPPSIDPMERQLLLGKLLLSWTGHLGDQLRALYGDEQIATPVSPADAFWLARDLAETIDQLHAENRSFEDIMQAAGRDVSQWWELTLRFLEIIRTEWPNLLEERHLLDPADHRNRVINLETRRLRAVQPTDPIIVAGSTGSIPAVAQFIKAVATLPAGAVVLPGYEADMDGALRDFLEHDQYAPDVVSHPQFGLHHLVRTIGAGSVEQLGADPGVARAQWVRDSFKPASVTGDWISSRTKLQDAAFDGVSFVSAPNERLEAACIALTLRRAILEPDQTAALVTPDRNLARRVVSELARFGITANDSGGSPFLNQPQGSLLELVIEVVFNSGNPAAVLSLLKHPLVHVGVPRAEHRKAVFAFEVMIMRGSTGRFDPQNICRFVEGQLSRAINQSRPPDWLERFSVGQIDGVKELAERLERALEPLVALSVSQSPCSMPEAVAALVKTLEALSADDMADHRPLYDGESGAHLASVLTRLLASDEVIQFVPDQWPSILNALISGDLVKPEPGGHPRVSIWGTLEARLQTVDCLVLGGLNEGTWPSLSVNDAFLTRGQKHEVGLQPPERRTGLSAHDFYMAMGQREVVLTRSLRAEGAPTIASRWWQRLITYAGPAATQTMEARGEELLSLAQAAETRQPVSPAIRPNPTPPLSVRPKRFSVTEIETLKNDPYAIYARKVLRLKPMDELIRDPDASDRGALIHAILERAVFEKLDFTSQDAVDDLRKIGEQLFEEEGLPPEIRALWWTRFKGLLIELVEWERKRQGDIEERFAELRARSTDVADTGVTLSGRADRIDLRSDGLIDILDYKTGTVPAKVDIRELRASQLSLEAALAARGAFEEVGKTKTNDLIYLKLGGRGEVKPLIEKNRDEDQATDLGEAAWERLETLLHSYNDIAQGYPSMLVARKQRFTSDYDHLARVLEWSAGDDTDEGGDG